jgi:hypothetical protein
MIAAMTSSLSNQMSGAVIGHTPTRPTKKTREQEPVHFRGSHGYVGDKLSMKRLESGTNST